MGVGGNASRDMVREVAAQSFTDLEDRDFVRLDHFFISSFELVFAYDRRNGFNFHLIAHYIKAFLCAIAFVELV